MKSLFVTKKTDYDGSQLQPLYAYVNHKLHGDSIVAFAGACNVSLENMVDAEDFVVNAEIKSDSMLHFIVELFGQNLVTAVSLQRLLVAIAHNLLHEKGHTFVRKGDDLYQQNKKLSVSIASVSAVSAMIHFGININNEGTPVPTCALSDFGLDAHSFGQELLGRFSTEYVSIIEATQKVRPL